MYTATLLGSSEEDSQYSELCDNEGICFNITDFRNKGISLHLRSIPCIPYTYTIYIHIVVLNVVWYLFPGLKKKKFLQVFCVVSPIFLSAQLFLSKLYYVLLMYSIFTSIFSLFTCFFLLRIFYTYSQHVHFSNHKSSWDSLSGSLHGCGISFAFHQLTPPSSYITTDWEIIWNMNWQDWSTWKKITCLAEWKKGRRLSTVVVLLDEIPYFSSCV